MFEDRLGLDWYVDSGKENDGGASKSITASVVASDVTLTSANHGYSNGDIIKIKDTVSNQINNTDAFKVSDTATNTFKIKTIDNTSYITYDMIGNNKIICSGLSDGTHTKAAFNGTWELLTLAEQINLNTGTHQVPTSELISWGIRTNNILTYWVTIVQSDTNVFSWTIQNATENTDNIVYQQDLGSSYTTLQAALNANWWNISSNAFSGATFGFGTGNVKKANNQITGLDHLENKELQVIGDTGYVENLTVSSGTITTTKYHNKIIAGLQFISTLKPMPIEPTLVNKLSQGRVKAVAKIVARFLNTKGASVGEEGRQLTNFPVVKTTNITGQPISLTVGQERFFIGSDFQKEKILEIKQDLPYPMTILSLATFINAEGG